MMHFPDDLLWFSIQVHWGKSNAEVLDNHNVETYAGNK